MKKFHDLLSRLPRIGQVFDDSELEEPHHVSPTPLCCSFDPGSSVTLQDVHLLLDDIKAIAPFPVKLEFDRCDFEEGALNALKELVQTYGGKGSHSDADNNNNNNNNNNINEQQPRIQSLHLSSKTLSLQEGTSIVLCSINVENLSVDIRNCHLVTSIEKCNNTLGYTGEARSALLPEKLQDCLDVTVSSVHSGVSETLNQRFVQSLYDTVFQFPTMASLSLGPFSLDNQALELLARAIGETHLERLLFSLYGGLTEPDALPLLTGLLNQVPNTLRKMEFFLSDIPFLFSADDHRVRDFSAALQHSPIDILELDNVGLTESSFVTLFKAAACIQCEEAHLWLNGSGYIGEKAFRQILDSLPIMGNFQTLSLVDSEPIPPFYNNDKLDDTYNQALMIALKQNTGLRFLNFEAGSVFYPLDDKDWSKLFVIWKRNEVLDIARHMLTNHHVSYKPVPCGLWPLAIQKLGAEEDSGCDAIYMLLRDLVMDLKERDPSITRT